MLPWLALTCLSSVNMGARSTAETHSVSLVFLLYFLFPEAISPASLKQISGKFAARWCHCSSSVQFSWHRRGSLRPLSDAAVVGDVSCSVGRQPESTSIRWTHVLRGPPLGRRHWYLLWSSRNTVARIACSIQFTRRKLPIGIAESARKRTEGQIHLIIVSLGDRKFSEFQTFA